MTFLIKHHVCTSIVICVLSNYSIAENQLMSKEVQNQEVQLQFGNKQKYVFLVSRYLHT